MLTVVRSGPLTTVQDRGRIGLGRFGVARSGAFSRAALDRVNRLVGNRASAAALEVLGGGLSVRCGSPVVVAVAGADVTVLVDGCPVGGNRAVLVPSGAALSIGTVRSGLRAYLGVRGGIGVDAVLGSRSTDTMAAIGPAPVADGDQLPIGDAADGWPWFEPVPPLPLPEPPVPTVLAIVPGPRLDLAGPEVLAALCATPWTVATAADRTGVRFEGTAVAAAVTELPSEGMPRGAVQLPGDGRPIVLGPDAGVTGGYPVIAVIRERMFDVLAQLRPGDPVRFSTRTG